MSILDEQLVLTVAEARILLRLGKGAMYLAIKKGIIKCIKINGKILVPAAEIRRILEANSEPGHGTNVPVAKM